MTEDLARELLAMKEEHARDEEAKKQERIAKELTRRIIRCNEKVRALDAEITMLNAREAMLASRGKKFAAFITRFIIKRKRNRLQALKKITPSLEVLS